MSRKAIAIAAAVVVVAFGAVALLLQDEPTRSTATRPPSAQQSVPPAEQSPRTAERIPAHYEAPPPSISSLEPTLSPESFTGLTKDAYRVAGEIPQTLAQLPCYCHRDEGFGHKSLQSCFVDGHAAHCAVCVNEALAAYKLQKQGLTPAQIRERIIAVGEDASFSAD